MAKPKKKKRNRKKFVSNVQVGGLKYKVFLVPFDYSTLCDNKGKSRYAGVVLWRDREIHIADDIVETDREFILFHEMVHAALEATGKPQWPESFLRPFTHIMWGAMESAGFITGSPFPRLKSPSTRSRSARRKSPCA